LLHIFVVFYFVRCIILCIRYRNKLRVLNDSATQLETASQNLESIISGISL